MLFVYGFINTNNYIYWTIVGDTMKSIKTRLLEYQYKQYSKRIERYKYLLVKLKKYIKEDTKQMKLILKQLR